MTHPCKDGITQYKANSAWLNLKTGTELDKIYWN